MVRLPAQRTLRISWERSLEGFGAIDKSWVQGCNVRKRPARWDVHSQIGVGEMRGIVCRWFHDKPKLRIDVSCRNDTVNSWLLQSGRPCHYSRSLLYAAFLTPLLLRGICPDPGTSRRGIEKLSR